MVVYLVNLFIVFFFLLLSRAKRTKNNIVKRNGCILISFLSIVLVAGLRYDVGTDFLMYNGFFRIIDSISLFSLDLEFMFVLFCKIASLITKNSVLLFIGIAVWTYYFIYKVAIKNIKFYELSIFLFIAFGFYSSSLNIVRQWMAIPFLMMALEMLSQNNKKKFVLFITLACLCHYTCIIIVPIIILSCLIKNDKQRLIIIIVSIFMYLFSDNIASIILQVLKFFNFGEKYYKYLLHYDNIDTNIFVMPMFSLVTYLGYLVYVKPKLDLLQSEKDKRFIKYIVNFVVLGFSTALLGTKLMYFERIQFYFLISLIFLIPIIVDNTKKNTKKLLYIFCIFMGGLFYVYSLIQNGGDPLPYQTFLTNLKIVISIF